MKWRTDQIGADTFLIMDEANVVRGSINGHGVRYYPEVLWSGPGGDIKGDFGSYEEALAFVEGVYKALTAVVDADGAP